MAQFAESIPLSLYIHLPWCVRKCPYCDFNSHAVRDALPERAYLDALLADLEQDLPRVTGRVITSIFIGGGTPSLFSAEIIAQLLTALGERLPLQPDLEITLEANPGTVEQGKFQEFRAAGVNRLSIGVQSFNAEQLEKLGRIHGRQEAFRAAEAAHAAGFDNFNLDIMFGLPAQTSAQAQADVANAIALEPAHISYYQLTLEPNTLFYRYPPTLPDDDTIWTMQQQGQRRLAEAGYARYEISAYAQAGKRCRHNVNYWEFGDYLGIGAGAHGKLTDVERGVVRRLWKIKQPRDYLTRTGSAKGIGGITLLSEDDLKLEFMLNALRLTDGVAAALFEARTGLGLASIAPVLTDARRRGLLESAEDRLCATELGLRFLNDLLALFMPEETAHA